MRFSTIIAGSLLTTGIVLSACQSENIEIPKSELYTREFIKEFGIADPNHDWNNASQGTVTVVTSSPTHVEVLADIKGKRYIFADYRKVTGTETINFTIPKGINNIIVTLNGSEVPTTLGATVNDTSRSRAIWEKEDEVVKITRDEYRHLTDEGVMAFKTYLPEGNNNLGKVTQNFSFIANGDFTIYPTYWCTNSFNTLGIYYIDEEKQEMVLVPFYTNKILPVDGSKGNLLYTLGDPYAEDKVPPRNNIPLKDENNPLDAAKPLNLTELNPIDFNNNGLTSFLDFKDEDWVIFKRRWTLKLQETSQYYFNISPFSECFDLDYLTQSGYAVYGGDGKNVYLSSIECEAKDDTHVNIVSLSMLGINDWVYPGTAQDSHPSGDVKGWKSRGIHISIKPGTKFGMYIRAWYMSDPQDEKPSIDNVEIVRLPLDPETGKPESDKYRRFFSEAKYNDEIGGSQVFGATYMYEAPSGTYRVLGFEDYGDVHDLNDMMFFITSEIPSEIPSVKDEDKIPEKYNYIIAAEDLGGTCDWDFNDLVIGVNIVSKNYVEAEDGVEGSTPSLPYKEVTVTPLASGGTLPIYLMYTGKVSTSQSDYNASVLNYLIGREFHAWLSNAQDAPLTPINVGANASTTGEPITFHIPDENYTLAMHDKYSASDDGTNNMGGFWVLVINQNDTPYTPAITDGKGLNQITDIPEGKGITRIEAPQPDLNMGNIAPQMLCIDHEWFWPREGKKIHLAYPASSGPGFEGWVNDPSVQGTWYGEGKYVESLVTKRSL